MIEPTWTTQTATQFVLRSDYPNVYITDEVGRDRYWVRSGVAEGIGLWSLRDLSGHELASVRQEESWPLPTYGVYRDDRRVATVREGAVPAGARWRSAVRAVVRGAPARLRYSVQADDAGPLEVAADAGAVEYHFERGGLPAATVGLRWLAWTPTFGLGVSVADGEDAVLILAVTAMIESAWGRL